MLYLHRYMFALIKPSLKLQWGLGTDELGYLDSAFSLCYLIFQVPFGALADVAGARLILTLLILTWSVGLGLHAWAPSVKALGVARAVLGAGQSAVFACLSRISRMWMPADVRTSVQGMVGVFFGRLVAWAD